MDDDKKGQYVSATYGVESLVILAAPIKLISVGI